MGNKHTTTNPKTAKLYKVEGIDSDRVLPREILYCKHRHFNVSVALHDGDQSVVYIGFKSTIESSMDDLMLDYGIGEGQITLSDDTYTAEDLDYLCEAIAIGVLVSGRTGQPTTELHAEHFALATGDATDPEDVETDSAYRRDLAPIV